MNENDKSDDESNMLQQAQEGEKTFSLLYWIIHKLCTQSYYLFTCHQNPLLFNLESRNSM